MLWHNVSRPIPYLDLRGMMFACAQYGRLRHIYTFAPETKFE